MESSFISRSSRIAADPLSEVLSLLNPRGYMSGGIDAGGDWSLQFQVNFSVAQFADQSLVQSELRKRIFKRLKREGISMPFPTRTIVLEEKTQA